MSLVISTSSEILKTKRTASFRLSIIGASFLPVLLFIVYVFKADTMVRELGKEPWESHLSIGFEILNSFIFPMYIILICSMIPQIEYKNNTWKQVYASPQAIGTIYFSKFITVHLM